VSGLDPNGGGTLVVPGGGTVAAADITDATATGIALVTATDAAAARTAIGVYSAAEVDAAIASVGSGTSRTSGTLAARPATPGAGDTYAVTSGTASGDRYACIVAGTWTLVGHDAIGGYTPTLRWKLDEASGTTAANSGSAGTADLTITGSPTLHAPVGRRGARGMALNAITKYASGYSVAPTSAAEFSTCVTFKLLASTGYFQPLLIRRLATPGEPYTWYLGLLSGGARIYYRESGAGSLSTLSSATGLLSLDTHHLAAVFSRAAGTLLLYLDGLQVASVAVSSDLLWATTGSPLWYVGLTGTAGEYAASVVCEAQIYDGTALSAANVAELAERALGAYGGQ